jgi:hypothetical protein
MTGEHLLPILEDFYSLSRGRSDRELDLLEAAMYLEDALGISLRDDEIIASNLGDVEALKRFVLSKAGS